MESAAEAIEPALVQSRGSAGDVRFIVGPSGLCNFDCVFCHREGGHGTTLAQDQDHAMSPRELNRLFDCAESFGYAGVTYTGEGEPTLLGDVILDYARCLKGKPQTLVTNGSRLGRTYLAALAEAGITTLNISLHSLQKGIFETITRQTQVDVDGIVGRIDDAVSLEFQVKINYVVLRGLNDSPTDIRNAVEFAELHKVLALRFIEVLRVKENPKTFEYYRSLADLEPTLWRLGGYLGKRKGRTTTWMTPRGLRVETIRCSCALSCRDCVANSDLFVTRTGYLKPCLLDETLIPIDFEFPKYSILQALRYRKERPG